MLYLFEYKQGKQQYYSSIMPLEFILKNSKALIYGEDEYGYQRALVKAHYNKISTQLLENKDNLVSPTSIILGVDEEKIKKYINVSPIDEKIYIFNEELLSEEQKLFRIVDGQHRLEGMRKAKEEVKELKDYSLNVIIMVLKATEKRKEVEVFSNINSKAKKLKTDLTKLALYKYDLIEKEIVDSNIEEFLIMTVCKILNDNEIVKEGVVNVWKNGIKLGVNDKDCLGIVSLNIFSRSIKKSVSKYQIQSILKYSDKSQILKEVEKYAIELATKILICWNMVMNIWQECFEKDIILYRDTSEEIYYKENYYLQKTMGTLVINELIFDCRDESEFLEIIKKSNLSANDWQVGGKFSGLSSMSGKNYILTLFKK